MRARLAEEERVMMLSQVERHNHGGIIVHTKPLVQRPQWFDFAAQAAKWK